MSENHRLVELALEHYSKRLRYLPTDPDVIRVSNDPLKNDLFVEAKSADELKDKVHKGQVIIDPTTDATILDIDENKRIIISAVNCYRNDLNKSKNLVRSKLGVIPKFDFIDKEVLGCDNFILHPK